MMVFFNDPVIVPDAVERAVRMTLAMRDGVEELAGRWRKRGHELHVGLGVAQGFATIGAIGFEGRWDYGAIGPCTNLAARLCGEAQSGQVLVDLRVARACERRFECHSAGTMALKGFARPVPAFAAARPRASADSPLAA
jgi:class 3 adenylate cyclase